ncbi:MAG: hypothetical protein HXM42_11125 [Lautropia mirabilis]|mgnify:FL=1|nr:hypothetical protein [Lautropia mirabilis]
MKRVWKKHDDVIPGVLKGIINDCFAWKLVRPEGRDQVLVVSGCQLLQSGLGDVFFESTDAERDFSWLIHTQLNETELQSLIEQSMRFQLFRLRHPLISFEKAWLSSLLVHDPDCTIYARYEGDDVLVISS